MIYILIVLLILDLLATIFLFLSLEVKVFDLNHRVKKVERFEQGWVTLGRGGEQRTATYKVKPFTKIERLF